MHAPVHTEPKDEDIMARFNPVEKMSTADKLLRLGTAGSFALLLLLATVQSFSDGPEPQAAVQTAEATEEVTEEAPVEMAEAEPEVTEAPADEPTDMAASDSAEAQDGAAEDMAAPEMAEAETTEAESTETAAVAEEPAATETEMAEAEAPAEEAEVAADAPAEEPQDFAMLANADIDRGEGLFRQCSTCHQYNVERNAGGPHLVGIVGRDIAAVESWRYSEALMAAEGAWTPEKLDQWLANPNDYIPGNRMAYPGVRAEQDRIDIIGFLAAQNQG
jgi:cytochrome c2